MLTARELNNLANHPAIRGEIAPGYQDLDFSKVYETLVIRGDAHGAIVLTNTGDGAYCWHWVMLPTMRGAKALALARNVIREVFTWAGARAIYGDTPRTNRAARLMNRALGASPAGTVINVFGQLCIRYILERDVCQLDQSSDRP